MGLRVLQKYNVNLTFGIFIAKFGFLIHHKTTENSKANMDKAFESKALFVNFKNIKKI